MQFNCHQCGASDYLGHKSMHQQFSSALRNREFETHNAHSLRLVEPSHGQRKVALRVEAVSKCYGEMGAVLLMISWSMSAVQDVILRDRSLAGVSSELLVLFAYGLASFLIALWLFRSGSAEHSR
jgi:hypothetical protein